MYMKKSEDLFCIFAFVLYTKLQFYSYIDEILHQYPKLPPSPQR